MKTKRYFLEKIYLKKSDIDTNRLIISDPCYGSNSIGLCSQRYVNFSPGAYYVILDVEESPFNKNFFLNSNVFIVRENKLNLLDNFNFNKQYKVSVDSGSLGIFSENGYNLTHNTESADINWYKNIVYSKIYNLENNEKAKLQFAYNEQSDGIIFSTANDGTKFIDIIYDENFGIELICISLSDKDKDNGPTECHYNIKLPTVNSYIIQHCESKHQSENIIERLSREIFSIEDGKSYDKIKDITVFENFKDIIKIEEERDLETNKIKKISIIYK